MHKHTFLSTLLNTTNCPAPFNLLLALLMLCSIYHLQFSSVAQSCPTLCDPMNRSTPGLPVHHQLLEFTQTHVRVSDAIQPSHPLILLILLLLPPVRPRIRVFFNESTLRMRWPKYWSFSFSIRPSNEHLGLISFRMDWLDLLVVQGSPCNIPNKLCIHYVYCSWPISPCKNISSRRADIFFSFVYWHVPST